MRDLNLEVVEDRSNASPKAAPGLSIAAESGPDLSDP